MTFEPLAVSDVSSNLAVMYPFSSAASLSQGFGSIPSTLSGTSASMWTSYLGGGLQLGQLEVVYSPFIDFSEFTEFTLTYWTYVNSYYCSPSIISFGLVDPNGRIFYGIAPCYGTSMTKITFDGTKSYNGFGWGQNNYGKNLQTLHGRRSGVSNYFWFGQGGNVYTAMACQVPMKSSTFLIGLESYV